MSETLKLVPAGRAGVGQARELGHRAHRALDMFIDEAVAAGPAGEGPGADARAGRREQELDAASAMKAWIEKTFGAPPPE